MTKSELREQSVMTARRTDALLQLWTVKEIAAIAPELVPRKAAAIRKILLHAVEEIYEPAERKNP